MLEAAIPSIRYGGSGSDTIANLRALPAEIIEPGDSDYDSARLLYNRLHDLYPAAIVRPNRLEDVTACLEPMKSSGRRLAIRGGGHHIAGFGGCDAGLVLDMSGHRRVTYDAATQIAEVEAGARLADIDRNLCPLGRVVPLGTVSDTGIAGLALGGGIGWLIGLYGLTCDNLVGADVVLAEGTTVRAEDHPDLLWALRGGGGNFGIVLRFRFLTHPLPTVTVGSARIPIDLAEQALSRTFAYLRDECPATLTVAPVLAWHDRPMLSLDFCLAAPESSGTVDAIGHLRERVSVGTWQTRSNADFAAWQSAFDKDFLPPMRGYWRSAYYRDIPDHALGGLVDDFASSGHVGRSILIEHLHGAFHAPREPGAFAMRKMRFGVLYSARWHDREHDGRNMAWVRNASDRLRSTAGQQALSYANYAFSGEHDTRARAPEDMARLLRIKASYDPNNLFDRNHNIVPDNPGGSAGSGA